MIKRLHGQRSVRWRRPVLPGWRTHIPSVPLSWVDLERTAEEWRARHRQADRDYLRMMREMRANEPMFVGIS